jgi:tripartite-type tricarboxylate transporter receptor subunit TctC
MTCAGTLSAQTFPNRPIRLLVAFAPGGGNDLIARVAAQKLTEILGQPVIVDNRAGGGGNVGAEIVSKSAPDGHTLLNISAAHAIAQTLYPKLNYSLTRDLAPIAILGSSPLVTVVFNGLPVRNVNDLVGWSKQNKMVYASGGIGVISHLAMEFFKVAVGVDGTHVPYKGAGPAATDVVSGQVHVMSNTLPSVLTLVKAGRFRAIGIMTEKRNASLPDVPTFIEQGYKDFVMGNWTGIVAPAATPRAIVNRLASDFTSIVRSPDVAERLTQQGFEPLGGTPEEFGRLIQNEVVRFGRAVKASGAKADG